jgi:hypothetical protein
VVVANRTKGIVVASFNTLPNGTDLESIRLRHGPLSEGVVVGL